MIEFAFDVTPISEWGKKLGVLARAIPEVQEAVLEETGLFFEREVKLNTPVQYGRLRASIGHAEDPALDSDGIWEMNVGGTEAFVRVGTNVEYAPYIEHGFTMSTGHVVFIEKIGEYRFVHPFSYRGAHMFERAVQPTADALEEIMLKHLEKAIMAAGLG